MGRDTRRPDGSKSPSSSTATSASSSRPASTAGGSGAASRLLFPLTRLGFGGLLHGRLQAV